DVEVAGVRMVAEKAIAVAPFALPTPAQPLERAIVEGRRALPALDALQRARVHDGEHAEADRADDDPPGRDCGAAEREPQQDRDDRRGGEPRVREMKMTAIEIGQPLAPAREAAFVFGARLDHDRDAMKDTKSRKHETTKTKLFCVSCFRVFVRFVRPRARASPCASFMCASAARARW